MHSQKHISSPLVIFDGECILCSKTVRFILAHETSDTLEFATLQSGVVQQLDLDPSVLPLPDAIMFFRDGKLTTQSTAALQIAAYLKMPYRLLGLLRIIPLFLRDPIYRLIAKNRYKWFGQSKQACDLLPESYRSRIHS